MNKIINLNNSVYQVYQQNPELLDIIAKLGIGGIDLRTINTLGRFVSVRQAISRQGGNLKEVAAFLEQNGYTVAY